MEQNTFRGHPSVCAGKFNEALEKKSTRLLLTKWGTDRAGIREQMVIEAQRGLAKVPRGWPV